LHGSSWIALSSFTSLDMPAQADGAEAIMLVRDDGRRVPLGQDALAEIFESLKSGRETRARATARGDSWYSGSLGTN
jgi:hypothetical protein